MPQRTVGHASNPVLTYDEIFTNPELRFARSAVETLTGKRGITEFEMLMRIELFRICARYGTGRRLSERFTIDRVRAARLARRLRKDAEEFEGAIVPRFKLAIGYDHLFTPDRAVAYMRWAAMLLEASIRETDDRNPDWTLEPKRELTQFVWRRIGKPCDRLVAEIIAGVLGLEKYTAEEHRKFRERYCSLAGTDSIIDATPKPDKTPQKKD